MSEWERTEINDLPVYQTKLLTSVPGIVQGFTTRLGGASQAPYATLNLGDHVEDTVADVCANRGRLRDALGFKEEQVVLAEQVHGREIVCVSQGGAPIPGSDALITNAPHLLLMLFFADCVPVYLVDQKKRAIGLVHAGWRGTVAGIVPGTVTAMQEQFGGEVASFRAAIGPCISREKYEVGRDVADQFRDSLGASANALSVRDAAIGTYTLDLRQIIFDQLLKAGLSADNISVCQEDTYRNEREFFSYRRDGKRTGRMAAFLAWN